MDTDRIERRARMLEKVRKLLAMARDGRGNENEEATAMRQANKLMAEWGIAEAECDMTAIDRGEMVFGEGLCGSDGRAPVQGKVYRSIPMYTNYLALGVARFTDTVVIIKNTENGKMFAFRGEKEDVLLARWLMGVLVESILREQRASGWTSIKEATQFRDAAGTALHHRLKGMAAERRAMYEQARATSNSRALVVVDRKALIIAERFGAQKTSRRSVRGSTASSGAYMAGQSAGNRINIPAGRPLAGSNNARLT